jgi:hypothetical protein
MRNLILFFICLFSVLTLSAQQPSTRPIYELTYIKAAPGKMAELLQCETQVWTKIHAQLKEEGKILDWSLWQVMSPGGSESGYDFVVVKELPDWKSLEKAPDYAYIFSTMDWTREERELFAKTDILGEVVKSEVYRFEGGVENGREKTAQFAAVNYMKTVQGENNDYFNMELKFFKPWFSIVVQNGKREGWSMLSLQFPWGEEVGYNGITVDYFNSLEQKFIELDQDWEQLHWEADLQDVVESMESRRRLVKGVLLKRVVDLNQ